MTSQHYILDFQNNHRSFKKDLFLPLIERSVIILKKQPHLKGKLTGGRIELALVNDKAITQVNNTFRGKNQPTDVISLSYFEKENLGKIHTGTEMWSLHDQEKGSAHTRQNLIGEIIISVDTAKRQALEHGKTLNEELQFLFAHGMLHIFGYDHENDEERKIMFDLQDKILGTKKWRKISEKPFHT